MKQSVEKAVKQAVERQIEKYPKATLKDLYKSFFQDAYGPGHLINDVEKAKNYLAEELASFTENACAMMEPTGWQGNYYRVNLAVVKNGTVSFDAFFDAFLQSAKNAESVDIESWKKEWTGIENIIRSMNIPLADIEKDSAEIHQRLVDGRYIGHHSEVFNKTYQPHYRIISKEMVLKLQKPINVTGF